MGAMVHASMRTGNLGTVTDLGGLTGNLREEDGHLRDPPSEDETWED